jgi:hypothetical protein
MDLFISEQKDESLPDHNVNNSNAPSAPAFAYILETKLLALDKESCTQVVYGTNSSLAR